MAKSMNVAGQTLIKTGSVVLGVAIEEPSAMFRIVPHEAEFHDTGSGPDIPRKVIYTGRTAVISATLGDCDHEEILLLSKAPGAASAAAGIGQIGTLGADVTTFPITLEPLRSGLLAYTFPTCRFREEWTNENWGVGHVNRWSLVLESYPDPTALNTSTTALFTTSVVGD